MNTFIELGNWFDATRERARRLGFARLMPWFNVGEKILQEEKQAREEALKALGTLQINHNPDAKTDALYARVRKVLTSQAFLTAFMLSLVIYGILAPDTGDDLRRTRSRVRVTSVRNIKRETV